MIEKVVGVNGFDLEVPISEHMAFLRYLDKPGVVGSVGRVLGEAGINIGGMQVARDAAGGHVLMVITVDSEIPAVVLSEISQVIGATAVRVADLDE
jgi:D-3-phosphoglycerate dehydrogenase